LGIFFPNGRLIKKLDDQNLMICPLSRAKLFFFSTLLGIIDLWYVQYVGVIIGLEVGGGLTSILHGLPLMVTNIIAIHVISVVVEITVATFSAAPKILRALIVIGVAALVLGLGIFGGGLTGFVALTIRRG
jgi:hypothetical protein